jgi:hypothetical protein
MIVIFRRQTQLNAENNLFYMADTYTCFHCKQDLPRSEFHEYNNPYKYRPVTSNCRKCRKEMRQETIYKTVCICCNNHRKLDINNQCWECNTNQGLRECSVCHAVKPLYLDFYNKHKKCKLCFLAYRKAKASQEPDSLL